MDAVSAQSEGKFNSYQRLVFHSRLRQSIGGGVVLARGGTSETRASTAAFEHIKVRIEPGRQNLAVNYARN